MAKKDRGQDQDEDNQVDMAVEEVESAPEDNGLVKMRKGDETLEVHPTTVKAHLAAGWKHA